MSLWLYCLLFYILNLRQYSASSVSVFIYIAYSFLLSLFFSVQYYKKYFLDTMLNFTNLSKFLFNKVGIFFKGWEFLFYPKSIADCTEQGQQKSDSVHSQ